MRGRTLKKGCLSFKESVQVMQQGIESSNRLCLIIGATVPWSQRLLARLSQSNALVGTKLAHPMFASLPGTLQGRLKMAANDAIALLKADHQEVSELLERFEKARSNTKQKIAQQICNALTVHAQIEEEIFYPA